MATSAAVAAATLALLLCMLPDVSGCGMVTHNLIANLSRQWFDDPAFPKAKAMIDSHVSALQGGAPFPDYLYLCGSDHDAGEDAHWPPFQAAAAKYIHDKYPQPWDEDTEKLVVFFLGVVSHYIADINWHGLRQVPEGQGFLRTLGMQNYNCTGDLCSVAHTKGDTGGEFVAAYEADLDFLHELGWYIPIKELVEIFKYAPEWVNKTVTAESIEECSFIFMAATFGTKEFGAEIFPEQVEPAPFLPEAYLDYYLGGIEDNAAWTSFMWSRMLKWATDGPPSGPLPPMLRSAGRRDKGLIAPATVHMVNGLRPLVKDGTLQRLFSKTSEGRGLRFKFNNDTAHSEAHDRFKEHFLRILATPQAWSLPAAQEASAPKSGKPSHTWQGQQRNELFGSSLCTGDLDGDGMDEVAVGSPGFGGVQDPQRGKLQWFTSSSTSPSGSLVGPETYERFGSACAILDLDRDGKNDLVVGAPSAGGKNLQEVAGNYTGKVYVFFNRGGGKFPAAPDTVFEGTVMYAALGTKLFALDENGTGTKDTLAIAVPYSSLPSDSSAFHAGRVYLVSAQATWRSKPRWRDTDITRVLSGEGRGSWFGHTVDVCSSGDAGRQIVVGAPGFHSSNGAVGRVYGFATNKTTPTFVLTGVEDRAKFGAAVACGQPGSILAVSAPSTGRGLAFGERAQSGRVYTFDLTHAASPAAKNSVHGTTDFARLGWTLTAVHGDGSFMVSAPFHGHEQGSLYKLDPSGSGTLTTLWNGEHKRGRSGWAIGLVNWDSDGNNGDIENGNNNENKSEHKKSAATKKYVVVASPRLSPNAHTASAGEVAVLDNTV